VTPTPLPTVAAMTVDVLDANYQVVSHFTIYGGTGTVASLSLASGTWVPETDGPLTVNGNQGAQGQWKGQGLDGQTQLPNGYYHLALAQSGAPLIDLAFWIKHTAYTQGNIVPVYNPGSPAPLSLGYDYPEAVRLEVRVYNLAGELVAEANTVGLSGVLGIQFRSSGGKAVAAGIYLVQVRGVTVGGGVEFLKVIKAAVTR
jgi:hypothetical protein